MAKFTEKAIQVFEDTYFKIISKPTMDLDAAGLKERAEVVHDMSLKMIKMETANLLELQVAFAAEHDNVEQALKTLEEATKANTDYLTLLQSADYALQIMDNFFLLLM